MFPNMLLLMLMLYIFRFLRSGKGCFVSLPQHYAWQTVTGKMCVLVLLLFFNNLIPTSMLSMNTSVLLWVPPSLWQDLGRREKRRAMVHRSNFPLVRKRLRGETLCSVDACPSDTGYPRKKIKSPK